MIANDIISLPFNTLSISALNVRQTDSDRNVEALAASILSQGLLQNLVVARGEDRHEVVAGGRRYRALSFLVANGKILA